MRGLAIINGDLVPGPGGYAEVTGRDKLIQDLSLAIREPFGSDPFHPRWGSLLDSYVGSVGDPTAEVMIQSEIVRVIQNYLAVKYNQIQLDASAGVKSRFAPGEVISRIASVSVAGALDSFYVRVVLETLDNTTIVISQTVSP